MWGVRGWIKVHSYTGHRADVLDFKTWFVGDEREPYRLLAGRLLGRKVVASLEGMTSPELAQACVGSSVAVDISDLPALKDGDFYWAQIEGLKAVDSSGESLGVVDHLIETGANDVLVVRAGEREILIPYVPRVVRRVDLENGIIELDWEADAWS